jgi:hypothetical protein
VTVPSEAEAAQHLAQAWEEIRRLRERFSQRSKDEKKRMGQLERLVPKLKRLAKPLAVAHVVPDVAQADSISDEEQQLLDSLKPPSKT